MSRKSRKSRKSTSSKNGGVPVALIGGILGALALVAVAMIFLRSSKPESTEKKLPVETYLRDSVSLRNNKYEIVGEVVNRVSNENSELDAITLSVESENGTTAQIGVFIPITLAQEKEINISPKDRYIFIVSVDSEGLLDVVDLRNE